MDSRLLTLQIFSLLAFSTFCIAHGSTVKVFNVMHYKALPNNKTDNSKAFMKAWVEACKWNGKAMVVIPKGTFYLNSVVFNGPCNGQKVFLIKGTLRAPTSKDLFFTNRWIAFQNVNELKIRGGGTLDGRGASAWPYNNCGTGSCKPLPISLRLNFVNDSSISNIKSINSKNFHFNIYSSHRIKISNITISAPKDSPNTDGIHVSTSGDITIDTADIATGDDCISIGPSNKRIQISNVMCGPGHGISVGSLGRSDVEEAVSSVSVVNCTFKETVNGVHIKTWPDSKAAGGFASNFTFDNLMMRDVQNPIFINQQYCPHNLCNPEGSSKIQISNITFKNIWGTSTTKDAVKLDCSKTYPCQNIALENINLIGPGGLASASCSNVRGMSRGQQKPRSCLS